jgi:hypothetical protein
MLRLPPPDPNESHDLQGLNLNAPVAIFLAGSPSPAADRLASAVLKWRPGALVVAAR